MTPHAMAFANPAYNGESFSPFGSKKNGTEPRPVMDAIRSVKTKTDVGVTAATTSSLESAPSEAAPTMFISII
jgi:hypothetical protein